LLPKIKAQKKLCVEIRNTLRASPHSIIVRNSYLRTGGRSPARRTTAITRRITWHKLTDRNCSQFGFLVKEALAITSNCTETHAKHDNHTLKSENRTKNAELARFAQSYTTHVRTRPPPPRDPHSSSLA